ncbi:DUF6600 domain-containing protein [Variovorax arabinosiphilus]|uniref:DUF6600 domain-containing protein n=1 Tax=Variovorax arabinosiphilus TaxID=3053498 RepID=UPI002575A4DB|nr:MULTISPECIES: DUF6600 domain-containing protein [unclassified Variovorax]MDM0120922.1 chromosome partitioning protein ParA [Variovorax sp. J2L1-78]MDM0129983.1 chromosome partitioning protein ParA [Variovorax sp. J2L1-63]MDM0233685.1 chromosome partitioning protein ParA [Variovorax sp. J2R1-6]
MTSFLRLLLARPAAWRAGAIGLMLCCAALGATAQDADPPGRVARLGFHQGTVSFSPSGDDSWYDVAPNRPLTTGDRLWTDRGARAELQVGSSAVRMDEQTSLELTQVDDGTTQLTVAQGTVQLRVRDDLAGQRVEVDTGNLAMVIQAAGDYRIDADPAAGTTRVAAAAGSAVIYGDNGESVALGARQQLVVTGRNLAAAGGAPQGSDDFDRWAAERNRLEDQSVSARYVSREVVGYQQLDRYGDWQNDPSYGNVWYPREVDADWAPYRDGQWVDVAPWGWTWVDAAPWGFAPFHYGRWARIGPRWGWVPGRTQTRPVYSPALVGFIGGPASANLAIGGGRHGVGWFPLAPGERWQPGYRTSPRYVEAANRPFVDGRNRPPPRDAAYAYQRHPGALTVVPADRFGRGRVDRRELVRLSDDRMPRAAVTTAAPVPLPDRGAGRQGGWGRPVAAAPPAPAQQQPNRPMPPENRGRGAFPRPQGPQNPREGSDGQRAAAFQQQQEQQQRQQQQMNATRQAQEAQRATQQQQQQMQIQRQQEQQVQQQRAAQAQMQQQAQRQQNDMRQAQEAQQRAAEQQQAMRQQQQAQQAERAQQAQRQQEQMQQMNAARQAQEAQQRAMQQQQQQAQRQQQQVQQQQQRDDRQRQQTARVQQAQQQQEQQRQQQQQQQPQPQQQQQGPGGRPGFRGRPGDQS